MTQFLTVTEHRSQQIMDVAVSRIIRYYGVKSHTILVLDGDPKSPSIQIMSPIKEVRETLNLLHCQSSRCRASVGPVPTTNQDYKDYDTGRGL